MSFMNRIVEPAAALRKRAAARGRAAEDIAARFLTGRGLKVLARNFRVRGGEIDLICEDAGNVVFVEVRLRSSKAYGGAAASITAHKQRRIILAARHWLCRRGEKNCRFDCVVMDGADEASIEWIRNAFLAD